jgi:hypothetical protein
VTAALAVTAVLASCGGGGEELGAPPVNSAATVATSVPTTTAPLATTTTTAASATTVPTTQPTTATTAVPTLTPELEAELTDVYANGRRVLYEALLDPRNADVDAVARYWTPEAVPGWVRLLEEWAAKQWRFEPGPGDRYYADVSSVELGPAGEAILAACVVSDAAVFDGASGTYIDPGYLSSYRHQVQLRFVDGRWLVHSDDMAAEFKDVATCGA